MLVALDEDDRRAVGARLGDARRLRRRRAPGGDGGRSGALGGPELGWLVVAGGGNVVGLLLVYGALRVGKVSIVAPIISTEGAIAAVLAVAAGEAIGVRPA